MKTAYFNRFELTLPTKCVNDCSHSGACDDDVKLWANKLKRPTNLTALALRQELSEYGTWDDKELDDDEANWQRIIWIAAGNIKEESKS